MKIGNTIRFGSFEWQVLNILENQALIITSTIIDQKPYHNKHESVTWEKSSLRSYLNSDFYNTFNEDEKNKIIKVINKNHTNHWYKKEDGNDTDDYIFILSLEEMAGPYFNNSLDLLLNKNKNQRYWLEKKDINNVYRRSTYLGHIWWYWVRTQGRVDTSAVYIHGDGNIGVQGNKASKKTFNTIHPLTKSNEGGIRPALWIKI